MGDSTVRTNHLRRGLGALVGCSPLGLVAASVALSMSRGDRPSVVGLGLELSALLIAGLNLYLSFVRGALHRRRTGSLDGYRHVSGLPLVGSLGVVLGIALGFGSFLPAAIGLIAVGADTGGAVWFVILTWRDASLWDARSGRF